jgi:hypothetical protein
MEIDTGRTGDVGEEQLRSRAVTALGGDDSTAQQKKGRGGGGRSGGSEGRA